ncbi:hypothetical protein [Spartinivicinus marinus]|nr:hypothetical protein [Spartinivicinus marinus]MCX4030239.1 hypothetical protein [Spartinivicinus marinus]MCX4030523.1 hypothetical protein [Spartinivicinus marinus]
MMSDQYEEKPLWFRLVVEMDNGQLHAVSLTDQQQEELQQALTDIMGDQPLRIHPVPFSTAKDMAPTLN